MSAGMPYRYCSSCSMPGFAAFACSIAILMSLLLVITISTEPRSFALMVCNWGAGRFSMLTAPMMG